MTGTTVRFMSDRPVAAGRLCLLVVMAGFTLAIGPREGSTQESVRLELGGAPGEWLQYTHRSDLVVSLPTDLGGPATTRTTIRLHHLFDTVSDDAIGYISTLEEISLDVRPTQDELPDLSGLRGLEFYHTATRAGRTVSLRLPGQASEADPGLLEQVENWLSQLGFPPLPGGVARVGEEWSETMPVPAAALGLAVDYDVVQTREVRLTEIRSAGSSTVALLAVTTTWEPAPDASGAGGSVVSLRGSSEQTVRFDVRRGRFLGSTGVRELELVLMPEGRAQYVAVNATGRQVTGLTASSDVDTQLRE